MEQRARTLWVVLPFFFPDHVTLPRESIDLRSLSGKNCSKCKVQDAHSKLLFSSRESERSRAIGVYTSLFGEMVNIPLLITSSYEGHLVCVASVQNNTDIQPTVSDRHYLRVVGEFLELDWTLGALPYWLHDTVQIHCYIYTYTDIYIYTSS